MVGGLFCATGSLPAKSDPDFSSLRQPLKANAQIEIAAMARPGRITSFISQHLVPTSCQQCFQFIPVPGISAKRQQGRFALWGAKAASNEPCIWRPRCRRSNPVDRKLCVPTFQWVCLFQLRRIYQATCKGQVTGRQNQQHDFALPTKCSRRSYNCVCGGAYLVLRPHS